MLYQWVWALTDHLVHGQPVWSTRIGSHRLKYMVTSPKNATHKNADNFYTFSENYLIFGAH